LCPIFPIPIQTIQAAEALGAIGDVSAIPVLERFIHDEAKEVSETCEIALDLLKSADSTSIADGCVFSLFLCDFHMGFSSYGESGST
jgi:HEAT repeat protein